MCVCVCVYVILICLTKSSPSTGSRDFFLTINALKLFQNDITLK